MKVAYIHVNYVVDFAFVFIVDVVAAAAVELCTHNLYYVIIVVF